MSPLHALVSLLPLLPFFLQGALAAPTVAPLAARAVNLGFPYGSQKVRGVNLGGWLVLEPWITPSLFDGTGNDAIIDEYTFCQYQDRSVATGKLKQHWDSWITENDIKWISEAGLNHIRVPIGYWAYDIAEGEPWINGQAEYLDKVVGWARTHNVKVMVDLHGAPGSQNGYDNSGRRGEATWAENPANVQRAVKIVESISRKYSDPSYFGVVTSLAMLNEPATYLNNNLLQVTRQYWYDAYGAARYPWGNSDRSGLGLIISDGFQPLNTFENYMTEPEHEGVLIDTHNYQVFDGFYNEWNYDQHLQGICSKYDNYSKSPLHTIIGEWSLASTDCTKYLNGRGIGSRYDGTYPGFSAVGSCAGKSGSGADFIDEYKQFLRKYYDTQTQVYEDAAQGWVFWTWKAEASAEWSYQAGLSGGWIPYDPDEHVVSRQQVCQ